MTSNKPLGDPRTRDSLDELASAADTAAHDVIGEARERVRQVARTGKDRVLTMRDNLEDRVLERPFQSLAIAAAVGVIFGMLVHRRRE
jgi:ElaB/YqjD/DUF883 family membrane-anchored ribosome-binding protein